MLRLFYTASGTSRHFHLTRLVHVHLTDLGSNAYHMRLLTCPNLSGLQNIYAYNHVSHLHSRFKRLELHREVLFYLLNVFAVGHCPREEIPFLPTVPPLCASKQALPAGISERSMTTGTLCSTAICYHSTVC